METTWKWRRFPCKKLGEMYSFLAVQMIVYAVFAANQRDTRATAKVAFNRKLHAFCNKKNKLVFIFIHFYPYAESYA